jgi:hypothetical protein
MAQTTRQTSLLVQQDWTKIYQTFTNADFASYDFETLRNTMINYIKQYYPETFNDFIESSEFIAIIDMIAFLGQSLAFRTDLNARENFIDTAQRRDSILKLARMLSYNPQRTSSASGLLKIDSIRTTEAIVDSNGINLSNATINWNDLTNDNWLEQFTAIMNAALVTSESIGKPGNSQSINGVQTDEYTVNLTPAIVPVAKFSTVVNGVSTPFEAVSATSVGKTYIYEDDPTKVGKFNILYQNDNNGNGSNSTGFFVYFKQGALNATTFTVQNAVPNNYVKVSTNNITNGDQWLYSTDVNGAPTTKWSTVPALPGINVIYNNSTDKNLYQVNTLSNDNVNLVFGDGSFSNIPQGSFVFYYRTANGLTYNISPSDLSSVAIPLTYVSAKNTLETLTIVASLKYTVTNANAAPSSSSIKSLAPQQYYTQNRMVNGEDYNIFPQITFPSIQKIKAVNRTSSGVSMYLDALDPTSSFSSTNIFCDDGVLTANNTVLATSFSFLTTNDIYNAIYNQIIPIIASTEMQNYYYATFPRYLAPNANIQFSQYSVSTSSSTGYLQILGNTQQVGAGTSGNLQYATTGASLQFLVNGANSYASVSSTVSNNSLQTPSLVNLGTVLPTGAVLTNIIPPYKTSLPSTVITQVIGYIQTAVNFGLYYDQVNQVWSTISPANIIDNTTWMIKFTYNQGLYSVNYKTMEYTFGSVAETNFYFDPTIKVYNNTTGNTVKDTIKILKINNKPNTSVPLAQDVVWQIYNTVTSADGYLDDTQVLVTSPSTQVTGIPDNPDLFYTISGNLPTTGNSISNNNLYFQYKHNTPARSRIDPTPVNIIDLYILTASYSTAYINWLRDTTNTVTMPTLPTSSSLEIEYDSLNDFKAISDSIVYNPAQFKPLFGAKADPALRANFQVVKNPAISITDNEIKTQVISAINTYFSVSNWSFGDTFYFSELAAYLHATLAPNISSIVIVPAGTDLVFGNYFQINSEPWEIITSAATVNNVQIVSAVTAAQLNLGNNLVGTY